LLEELLEIQQLQLPQPLELQQAPNTCKAEQAVVVGIIKLLLLVELAVLVDGQVVAEVVAVLQTMGLPLVLAVLVPTDLQ